MPSYRRALAAVLRRSPYAIMTDPLEIVLTLRAQTEPGLVPLGELNHDLDNMSDPNGVPVWERIIAIADGPDKTATATACRCAVRLLRDARHDYPGVNTRCPMFTSNVDALAADGLLTPAQADALKTKSDNLRTVASLEGLGRPPLVSEVAAALRGA